MKYLLTFHTNFDALQFSKYAKTRGDAKMKPVPRALSSSCGTCVMFSPKGEFDIRQIEEINFECVYEEKDKEYIVLLEKE